MHQSLPPLEYLALIDDYIKHGWRLVPVPRGTKGPKLIGWNSVDKTLASVSELPAGDGVGLAHAYSNTMALDIDDWFVTSLDLAKFGINLDELYSTSDAVVINSGREGRGKLLYKMPDGLILPSKKITIAGKIAYELRCSTQNGTTVQDVIPPSIHPITCKPYEWAGKGHWSKLPVIPESLLAVWQTMIALELPKSTNSLSPLDNTVAWSDIEAAIEFIPADCSRDNWVSIGMAIHWAATQTDNIDHGFNIWNEWSAQSELKYPGERAIRVQWNSFRTDKNCSVKLGTFFHIARQNGWREPSLDISGFFKSTDKSSPLPPAAVIEGIRPPPPTMDLEIWPSVLKKRAEQVADSVGCDPLVPLFAGLAAVCAAVDAQIRLELMPGFQVPPVLWLMTLGEPADKKSPGSRPMLKPLRKIEAEDIPRYTKERLNWEGVQAAHDSSKKNFLTWSASPEAILSGDLPPMVSDLPAPPVSLKLTVSDITSQKLVRHAADRPRGLLCHLDEMNSWIKKLTDKTSGEDRSAWVVSYESEHYEMDRVGAGSIHAENLAVSIYGNIQPTVFKENLTSLSSDGLIQRFIPIVLDGSKTRLGNPIPECFTNIEEWENTLRMIYALPRQTYKMSNDAFLIYREFQKWYEDTKRDERLILSNEVFMTAFGKIEGTAGRLILLFHIIESPYSLVISSNIVERVILLIKTYIIPSYRYVLGELGGCGIFDQWVSEYIIQHCDLKRITLSEIKRSARRPLDGKTVWAQDQMILSAMTILEKANWVIRSDDGSKEHQHYAEWAINPRLGDQFKEHRSAVIKAKQRIAEQRWSNSEKLKPIVYGGTDK